MKCQTWKLQNASPHNSTWRRAEGKHRVNRKGTGVLKLRWQGSTVLRGDGVTNHRSVLSQTSAGSTPQGVQKAFLITRAQLRDVKNRTLKTQCAARTALRLHTQWGRVCGSSSHTDIQAGPRGWCFLPRLACRSVVRHLFLRRSTSKRSEPQKHHPGEVMLGDPRRCSRINQCVYPGTRAKKCG